MTTLEPVPAADTTGELRFTARPSTSDVLSNAAALMRGSGFGIAFGTMMTATGVVALYFGELTGVFILIFGASFLSGLFVVPFGLWGIRQRRDLVLAPLDVQATSQGITLTAAQGGSHSDWSVFRTARETSGAFILDTGAGAAMMITKRGVDAGDVSAFRDLLLGAGLLRRSTTTFQRLRPLLWVAVGLAVTATIMLGGALVSANRTTASMDLEPTIQGTTVTVRGTTDLPEGATVILELVQVAAWDQLMEDGNVPPGDTSDWWLDTEVKVQDGGFTHTFDVGGWSSGQVTANAYFWVDGTQPQAVIDRFGLDGSDLYGPDVVQYEDGQIGLEVRRTFELTD